MEGKASGFGRFVEIWEEGCFKVFAGCHKTEDALWSEVAGDEGIEFGGEVEDGTGTRDGG